MESRGPNEEQEGSNPYAAPGDAEPTDGERLRQAHWKSEAAVKVLGLLFILVGTLSVCWGAGNALTLANSLVPFAEPQITRAVVGSMMIVIALSYLVLGAELRELNPGGRKPAMVLSVICLINVPIGTVLSLYALILLSTQGARTVLSKEYAEAVKHT